LRDCIKHRLEVAGRGSDEVQDFGGRNFALARPGKLVGPLDELLL